VLEVQQIVYRTTALPTPPRTLDDLMPADKACYFRQAWSRVLIRRCCNNILLPGAASPMTNGTPILDVDPLRTVLHYYEQSIPATFAGPQLLDYTSSVQYWPIFLSARPSGQVDSTTYLSQRAKT